MSVAELFALEAQYNCGKSDYKNALSTANHTAGKPPTQRAAQMNVDLQSLLLQMSNLLDPSSKEQCQLLKATDLLQVEYQQLTDSNVVATMNRSHFMAWSLGGALLFFLTMRGLLKTD